MPKAACGGTGGDDDALRLVLLAPGFDSEWGSLREIDFHHLIKFETGAEMFGLFLHHFHQFGTGRGVFGIEKAGVIFHFGGDGDLAADLRAGDYQRIQLRAGGVKRGGQTRRTGADDDYFFFFHCLFLPCVFRWLGK
jgi:hypothetical protein